MSAGGLKIIVTGVAGFIGSNLTRHLLQRGHRVIGIDNFSYGLRSNMESFINDPNFVLIEKDLCADGALDGIEADVLTHLASYKIPRYSTAFPTLEFNGLMLKNVVKHCVEKKIKLVYASTSDVYGKNATLPFHEESDLVMGPTTVKRWAYAVSKMYGELYILAHHDEFGLEYSIPRFFGSYGPNQNLTWWGGPQAVFITLAIEKKPIEIHGDGSQTRTFTFVEDTVDGLLRLVLDKKANSEIFNIGTEPETEITIVDLATLIWKLVNPDDPKPMLNFIPYASFGKYEDVMRRVPDISKIKNKLGFKPRYNLETGLRLTIDWQRKVLASK